MNRQERRSFEQFKKTKIKQYNNLQKQKIKTILRPCAYVDNKPIYLGFCVFLKKDTEIQGQYDWTLNKLIEKNHRFVIITHGGSKKGAIGVALLSTSSYLNEENRLGIKLYGNYHTNKYVYMDSKNLWLINSNCIKSVDYILTSQDMCRCIAVARTNNMGNVNVKKGLLDDSIVDKYLPILEQTASCKISKEEQDRVDTLSIMQHIESLPMSEVLKELDKISQEDYTLYSIARLKVLELYPKGLPTEGTKELDKYRRLVLALYLSIKNSNDGQISKTIQLGYE